MVGSSCMISTLGHAREPWGMLGEHREHVSSVQISVHTYVDPNLHNINLLDVTPSLISQNPREWMFSA